MTDRIPLTSIPRQLAVFDGRRPDYPQVYKATINGDIPAEQTKGRWFVLSSDLDTVARHFGMTPKSI